MKEIVAVIFGLALLGNAALFVPQAVAVWRKKSDEGISLVTFGGFCILQIIGVIHGVYQHDNSLIVGLGASFLTCGTVTLLTIVYRIRRLRGRRSIASLTWRHGRESNKRYVIFHHIPGCEKAGTTVECSPAYTALPRRQRPLETAGAPRHIPG